MAQKNRRQRRRRTIAWVAALVLTVLLVGAAAAPLLFTSSGTTAAAPTLSARTLLRLPSASALAQDDGAAYVTDDLRDLLLRFDPGSGRVERSVHLEGRPAAMVLGAGHLWVADAVDNEVVEVDPRSLRVVRSVAVPANPSGLAVLDGAVWVTSTVADAVTPIDLATGRAGPPIKVPAGAVRVAAGFGALWVTGTIDLLTRIVPSPGGPGAPAQRTVAVGEGPAGVAIGAGAVWVADERGGVVAEVDPRTLVVDEIPGRATTRCASRWPAGGCTWGPAPAARCAPCRRAVLQGARARHRPPCAAGGGHRRLGGRRRPGAGALGGGGLSGRPVSGVTSPGGLIAPRRSPGAAAAANLPRRMVRFANTSPQRNELLVTCCEFEHAAR